MLIVLTNSGDATADYLESVLKESGVPVLRLDTDTLISRIEVSYRPGQPEIHFEGQSIRPTDIGNVWYRRPERLKSDDFDDSPDSAYILDEWAEGVEAFLAHIQFKSWINHPSSNALASRKLQQLSLARSLGLRIPDSVVTQNEATLLEFFNHCDGNVIVKPLSRGYIERQPPSVDSLIYTNEVRAEDLNDLSDLSRCPTFFQRYINKASDVRITVVDDDFHAVEIVGKNADGSQRCDIRRNNMVDVEYRPVSLPETVHERLRRLVRHYGLRFAAIDMAVSSTGEWYFFEVNPNGQWAWLDLNGVTTIADSFLRAFSSDNNAIHHVSS